jgi:hypothetical protein
MKAGAFALSAGITGLAGSMLAHHLKYLTPDGFTLLLSLELVLMVVIGGLGSLRLGLLGLGHGRLQGLHRCGHVGRLNDALRRVGFTQDGQDLAGVFGQKDQVTRRLGFEFVNHDGIVRRESPRMAPPAPWLCPRSKK